MKEGDMEATQSQEQFMELKTFDPWVEFERADKHGTRLLVRSDRLFLMEDRESGATIVTQDGYSYGVRGSYEENVQKVRGSED